MSDLYARLMLFMMATGLATLDQVTLLFWPLAAGTTTSPSTLVLEAVAFMASAATKITESL